MGPGLTPGTPSRPTGPSSEGHTASSCLSWSLPTPTPIPGAQPEAAEQTLSRLKARGPGNQDTRENWGLECQNQKDFPGGRAPQAHSWFRV